MKTAPQTLVIAVEGTPSRERLQAARGRRARAKLFAAHHAETWRSIRARIAPLDLSLQAQEAIGTAIITGPPETLRGLLEPGGALHGIEGIREVADRRFTLPSSSPGWHR